MLDFLKEKALSLALAAVPIGGLVFLIVQWCKRTFTGINEKSPFVKRAYVVAGAAVLAALTSALGIAAPCDPGAAVDVTANCLATIPDTVWATTIKAVLAGATAFLIHAGKKGA